ncbi:hypothetical protein ElyMa_005487600 [Elysia marginata]|uniref:Myelin basic protein n=1 Tax=Elysia marginata TaxID=1093978 RepID=A0AAV4ESS2_9GAST|nr:hypothetical protein ElyMa_005487600 [Elysia marginata]
MSKFKKFFTGKSKDKRSSSIAGTEASADVKAVLGGRARRGSESSISTSKLFMFCFLVEAAAVVVIVIVVVAVVAVVVAVVAVVVVVVVVLLVVVVVAVVAVVVVTRRMSKRAQAAMNEKIDTAPTLPSRAGRRRGAFKSFILD